MWCEATKRFEFGSQWSWLVCSTLFLSFFHSFCICVQYAMGFDVSWHSIHSTQLHPSIFILYWIALDARTHTHANCLNTYSWILVENTHTHTHTLTHTYIHSIHRCKRPVRACVRVRVNERNGWNYRTPHRQYSDKSDLVK